MATMKAALIRDFGGPEAVTVDDIELPEPGAGEVLIRVQAASVNPVDYKTRAGEFGPVTRDQLPKVLGRDASGIVERAGPEAGTLNPGDEVYTFAGHDRGCNAEFVAVKGDACAPKPSTLSHVAAAAVPLAALTAWQGLFDHGGLQPTQSVLIHGGGGGVGHFAVQLAKARGATVYTTVSPEDVEFVRGLGADEVIDYKAERFEHAVGAVDLVLDLIAGDVQDRSWTVVKEGGTIVSALSQPSEERARDHRARGTRFMAQPNGAQLAEIGRMIDEGTVTPYVQATYTLDEVANAHRRVETQHSRGKVVIEIGAKSV